MPLIFLTILAVLAPFVDHPGATANAPVIIGLHGRGDTPEGFSHLADRLGPQFHWLVPRGPLDFVQGPAGAVHCVPADPHHPRQMPGPACWFDRQTPDGGQAALQEALELVDAQVRVAGKKPVALLGFSQGCMLAAHYVAAHPDRVRAVLCIGGMLLAPVHVPAGKHAVQVRFVHGKSDPMVPFASAQEAVATLQKAGLRVTLTTHDGGHVIPAALTPELNAWLAAQLQ